MNIFTSITREEASNLNCFEQYLVELLQGHITINNKPVEVVKHFSNAPQLPVITLDLSGGVTTDYVYHDTDSAMETVYYHRIANINLNVWCNTDVEKEQITEQILDCYYKEKTYHYEYCSKYVDGMCTTLGASCRAEATETYRTIKNKCPDPEVYEYQSLAEKHHICKGTIHIEPPFDMDEFTRQPPLLRSIFRCRAEYEEPVFRKGTVIEDIDISGVDIQL